MCNIESGAEIGVGKSAYVFNDSAAIHHGVVFQGTATSYHGGGTDTRAGSDIGRAQHASPPVNLCATSDPNPGLDFFAIRFDLNALHEGINCQVAKIVC